MNQEFGSVLVLAGCCATGISVVFVVWYLGYRAKLARFKGKKVFVKHVIPGSALAPGSGRTSRGLIYNSDLQWSLPSVSEFYSSIPSDLRAFREEESGVIVELRWAYRQVGLYTGGGKAACIVLCTVVCRETASGKAIDSAEFKGSAPPREIFPGGTSPMFGAFPTEEIKNYLRKLLTPKERTPSSPRHHSSQ